MATLDGVARRYYPAIVCGLIGVTAYLQGAGISSLVAEQLPAAPAPPAPLTAAGLSSKSGDKAATPILARNAFDSVTGPLTGQKPKPVESAPAAITGPAGPPKCATGSVVLITESEDPAFSFALIKTTGTAKMRRIGDDVDGKKVETIGWDRVVLGAGESRCQLMMHDDAGPKAAGGAPAPTDRSKPSRGNVSAAGTGITKISETEYVVEKDGPEKMTQMQQAFMKSGRVVAGKGIRIQRAAATTILPQLGMKQGDMVKTINGFDMNDPDQAMQAYAKVKTAKKVTVTLERDGQPVQLDFTIK